MRRDAQFLDDIVAASEAIGRIIAGQTLDSFVGDETLRSAVLYQLVVIGEATSRLSAELRTRHATVPWSIIIGFRNVAVHAYFAIDWSIVWTTATTDVPHLREQITRVVSEENERSD